MRNRIAVLLVGLSACSTANLWPTDPPSADAEALGRQWMREGVEAQGGEALSQHSVLRFTLRDEWPSWLWRTAAMPWPRNDQRMTLDVRVGTDDVRLTFVDGPAGDTGWGIQSWQTYRVDGEGLRFDDEPDDVIRFWLPTTAYFPVMAWRIQEATFVRALGMETIGGIEYRKVFATWGGPEPGPQDQYLLYYDAKTHLLTFARYTVRDMGASLVGLVRFEDYREVGELLLSHSMRVVDEPEQPTTGLHRFVVEKAEVDPELPPQWLSPKGDLPAAPKP